MIFETFHIRVPGKWVLAGEHTVLRGGTAVALPHPEFALELTFQPQVWEGLSVVPPRAQSVIEELLAEAESAVRARGGNWIAPRGSIHCESTIPMGAGLGSSAAFCVAVTQWLQPVLQLDKAARFMFARTLEDRFHGRSSGMDVAVALAAAPLAFTMEGGAQPLSVARLPRFTFHDTGLRASTKDCVAQVEAFRRGNPAEGQILDARMNSAARLAKEALLAFSVQGEAATGALTALARALRDADSCFQAWGLVPPQAHEIMQDLARRGALASKLTGAGAGGFVVALWPS